MQRYETTPINSLALQQYLQKFDSDITVRAYYNFATLITNSDATLSTQYLGLLFGRLFDPAASCVMVGQITLNTLSSNLRGLYDLTKFNHLVAANYTNDVKRTYKTSDYTNIELFTDRSQYLYTVDDVNTAMPITWLQRSLTTNNTKNIEYVDNIPYYTTEIFIPYNSDDIEMYNASSVIFDLRWFLNVGRLNDLTDGETTLTFYIDVDNTVYEYTLDFTDVYINKRTSVSLLEQAEDDEQILFAYINTKIILDLDVVLSNNRVRLRVPLLKVDDKYAANSDVRVDYRVENKRIASPFVQLRGASVLYIEAANMYTGGTKYDYPVFYVNKKNKTYGNTITDIYDRMVDVTLIASDIIDGTLYALYRYTFKPYTSGTLKYGITSADGTQGVTLTASTDRYTAKFLTYRPYLQDDTLDTDKLFAAVIAEFENNGTDAATAIVYPSINNNPGQVSVITTLDAIDPICTFGNPSTLPVINKTVPTQLLTYTTADDGTPAYTYAFNSVEYYLSIYNDHQYLINKPYYNARCWETYERLHETNIVFEYNYDDEIKEIYMLVAADPSVIDDGVQIKVKHTATVSTFSSTSADSVNAEYNVGFNTVLDFDENEPLYYNDDIQYVGAPYIQYSNAPLDNYDAVTNDIIESFRSQYYTQYLFITWEPRTIRAYTFATSNTNHETTDLVSCLMTAGAEEYTVKVPAVDMSTTVPANNYPYLEIDLLATVADWRRYIKVEVDNAILYYKEIAYVKYLADDWQYDQETKTYTTQASQYMFALTAQQPVNAFYIPVYAILTKDNTQQAHIKIAAYDVTFNCSATCEWSDDFHSSAEGNIIVDSYIWQIKESI